MKLNTKIDKLTELKKICNMAFDGYSNLGKNIEQEIINCLGIKKYNKFFFDKALEKIEYLDKVQYNVTNYQYFNVNSHLVKCTSNFVIDKISSIYNNSLFFDLIIHGSYADNTYTSASDVDDVVIIKRKAFENFDCFLETKKKLYQLNSYYQYVDPMQHHGHWIITEFDLLNYNQSIMPVCVFNDALSIDKNLWLNIYIDIKKSNQDFFKILDITLNTYRIALNMLYTNNINLFYLKILISCIALIIPLLFQVKGEILSKKEAIPRSCEILDDRAMKIIEWSTFIRKNWDKLPSVKNYNSIRLISKLFSNRKILEYISRERMPRIHIKDILGLDKLKQSDFVYFLLFIENEKNENYK